MQSEQPARKRSAARSSRESARNESRWRASATGTITAPAKKVRQNAIESVGAPASRTSGPDVDIATTATPSSTRSRVLATGDSVEAVFATPTEYHPAVLRDEEVSDRARRLANAIEPVVGQVYFSPECHSEYAALGFNPSPAAAEGVALPDGPAYFTSRGSLMGQVPGELVAAAFAVFNPEIVVPCVQQGWALTDAATICEARTRGARRATGAHPRREAGRHRPRQRAARGGRRSPAARGQAVVRRRPRPRPAGRSDGRLLASWCDQLREYRGDAHTAAWTTAGFDATEIGLLTELFWGLPMRSYIRSRAWSNAQLDAAEARLEARGLVKDGAFTELGRATRGAVELATDLQMRPALDAIADDFDELVGIIEPWSTEVREAGGYLKSTISLTGRRD